LKMSFRCQAGAQEKRYTKRSKKRFEEFRTRGDVREMQLPCGKTSWGIDGTEKTLISWWSEGEGENFVFLNQGPTDAFPQ